jgi:dipeptidase E
MSKISKAIKIVAFGGGEIGRPGYPVETTLIDKEIIKLTEKKHPRLLFVPTASHDADIYIQTVQKHFGKKFGCVIDVLALVQKPALKDIKQKITSADIVYVGGGNTLYMMNLWRKYEVDKHLVRAARQGKVMAGGSAGSICWFQYGLSDSRRFHNAHAHFIKVKGLGILHVLHCPHYDVERERKPALKKMMKHVSGVAIALDNCCALEVIGNKYRIIKSRSTARAYRTYWYGNKYFEEVIESYKQFQPLSYLLKK